MPLATAFRLSFYVTLGLACACLALAESFFLWWMGYFLVGTLILLGLAYRWEGRWALTADAANRLGMVIAIATAFWIVYNLPHSEEDLLAADVPWPAGLLPHLGPLLILLLLVKLFRPKRLTDYWAIHTIGLMMATLGCVLAAEPLFGVLLVLYLASLLWSLALFYMVRSQESAISTQYLVLSTQYSVPWRHLGLGQALRWTVPVVLSGLVLFLVAPRQDNFQWEPKQLTRAAKGIMKTGFEGGMDCGRLGKIEMSEAPAFEVQAASRRGPKLDLDPEMRWPMQTLDFYFQGRWSSWNQPSVPQHLTWGLSPKSDPLALPSVEGKSHPRTPPADLADPDFYLYFKVRLALVGSLVLAEPLQGTRLGLYPHLGEVPVEGSFFFHLVGTDSVLASQHDRRRLFQYGQVLRKPDNPNTAPAKEINPRYRQFLVGQDVPEAIALWVRELLGKLPDLSEADCQLDAKGRIPANAHSKVAQALTHYLAFSGDFGYSLYLSRRQMNLDPLADFLLYVKEGHCERFAGGLTLMLRSLGIPARVVKGYRGVDHLDQGHYVVRQNQAHSWVQALVKDETGATPGGEYWLTLDPTPAAERANKPLLSWFGWLFQGWIENDLWRNYVLDYNADQQGHAFESLRSQLTMEDSWSAFLVLPVSGGLLAGAFWAVRFYRRRVPGALPCGRDALTLSRSGFYHRFLEMAARLLNLQPEPGQTPREFGLQIRLRLEQLALDEACSAIPLGLVDLLYRARFGGQILTEAEERQANSDVQTLETALLGKRDRPVQIAPVL